MNDQFTLITWPEIQDYMDMPGFNDNAHLIIDDKGIERYGSSAYFVSNEWISSVNYKENITDALMAVLVNMKNVFVPIVYEDTFLRRCEKDGININGGALKLEDGSVVGKYYYVS